MKDYAIQFEEALLSLNRIGAEKILATVAQRMNTLEIVDSIISKALVNIGTSWEKGHVALSQVYMSGRICEELVDRLLPPGDKQRVEQPPMALALLDDYHMLGKRIVYSVIRASGYDIKDYGRVTIDETIDRVRTDGIRLLLVSTLMLHSALHIKDLINRLKTHDPTIKVIVGGAPFNFDSILWQEIGADAMGRNAAEAVDVVRTILGVVS